MKHLYPSNLSVSSIDILGIQTGEVTLTGTSITDALSAVVKNKSFLVFQYESADNLLDPENNMVYGEITNTTTLTFGRVFGGGNITIRWWVVEGTASGSLSVQHGSKTLTGTTENVAISAVNLSNSFPIVSYQVVGTGIDWEDFVSAELTSATNLQLKVGSTNTQVVKWQIITNSNWTVSKYTDTIADASTQKDTTISAVTLSDTWLILSAMISITGGIQADDIPKVKFLNTTTIRADRFGSTRPFNLVYYVIEGNGGFSVEQEADISINAGFQSATRSISAVDTSKSIISMSSPAVCLGNCQMAVDAVGTRAYIKNQFNSSTQIQLERVGNSNQMIQTSQVVEFAF